MWSILVGLILFMMESGKPSKEQFKNKGYKMMMSCDSFKDPKNNPFSKALNMWKDARDADKPQDQQDRYANIMCKIGEQFVNESNCNEKIKDTIRNNTHFVEHCNLRQKFKDAMRDMELREKNKNMDEIDVEEKFCKVMENIIRRDNSYESKLKNYKSLNPDIDVSNPYQKYCAL